VKIPRSKYHQLQQSAADETCPQWLVAAGRSAWNLDLAGQSLEGTVLVRPPSPYGYARASYELNLGCNYDCEHCYLGLKRFEGLSWPERERLLHIVRDAGVLWFQLTGGEPLIDPLFSEVYGMAYELGMMLTISSNGSRLHHAKILDLLTTHRPYRIVISIYGATEETYDGLTRRRGSFKAFQKGLAAAHEAGLPLRFNVVVTDRSAHEVDQMRAMADRLGAPHYVYSNISPTIYGGPESLTSQATEHLRKRKPLRDATPG
jgi:MoaA/NifB/PqqE/SkfB family radical SAM enzyme